MIELDAVDKRIVDCLVGDASLSNNEIARRVGLTAAPLSRRLARLIDAKVIRHTVHVDPGAMGIGLSAFLEVTLERSGSRVAKTFVDRVTRMPEVVECHMIAGHFDFMLKINVRDIDRYKTMIWSEFKQADEIKGMRSTIILDSSDVRALGSRERRRSAS